MSSIASPDSTLTELSFEQALTQLQDLVARLEGGALSLEETITTFKQGSELATHCQRLIADAELRITKLTEPEPDPGPGSGSAHARLELPGL